MSVEMIVSPFLEVLFDQLSSLISREYRLLSGFNKDLEKLSGVLSTIKDVLGDAEDKQIKDRRTTKWLSKLKDAAYDAEDVLDECEYEALKNQSELGDNSCTKQVSESFSACFDFKQIFFRREMGKRIKGIIEKFDEIDAERSKFQLNPGVPVIVDEGLGRKRETSYIITEPKTYGRDEEKNTIIRKLLDNSKSSNDLSIYPILGIGGVGKTTLAQLIYNDQEIVSQFDTRRIWICVSEDFSVKRITKMIIDHLIGKKCDLEDLSPMQTLLKNLLNGSKYLLVLDDVWDDAQENWTGIIRCLQACEGKRSSIIVTTRLPTVVEAITPLPASCIIDPTCNLKCLSENDAWCLFEHYALGAGDRDNEDLVAIGKVVVAKCKGNPLAINAVGRLLNSQNEEFWRQVRDSEIWQLEECGETRILPALRLSYHHLPPHFRQCFAYCSVYPKDWHMSKEMLIDAWMANGFIQCSRGKEVEDVGDDIFNGLLQRHFFQDIKVAKSTKEVSCKMHDLLHDLACSVTKNGYSRMKISETDTVSPRVRRVPIICSSPSPSNTPNPSPSNALNSLLKSQPYIHTLLFFVPPGGNLSGLDLNLSLPTCLKHLKMLDLRGLWNLNYIPLWIGHLRLLKLLNLEGTGIASLPKFVCGLTNLQMLFLGRNEKLTELPSSFGKLKNLRYLDLSYTSIEVLPKSICMLSNLQTLKLDDCLMLERLPSDVKNMKGLRNFMVTWMLGLKLFQSGMPVGIGELTRLEVLRGFVVSNASEDVAGIQELGGLNRLKARLSIYDIKNVRDPRDALQAKLRSKHKLTDLLLYWGISRSWAYSIVDIAETEEKKKRTSQVLESLEPHPNIQHLQLGDYPGVELPGWILGELPNLQIPVLSFMPNAIHVLQQLPPNLKKLWIVSCPKLRFHPGLRFPSSIKELSVNASNDPSLSSLEALPHLSKLRIEGYNEQEISLLGSRFRNLTSLRKLSILKCSNVKSLLPEIEITAKALMELQIRGCVDLDCLTEEGLRNLASLEQLCFSGCKGLTSISDSPSPLQHLTSLTQLVLSDCPKLDLSAVGFQQLVSLKFLQLEGLPQLTSLPDDIQHVKTLQELGIMECENLEMLPEWLQQHRPLSLYYLEIIGCHPKLHKRCEMDKGEDWHKISHLQLYITDAIQLLPASLNLRMNP